jgi:hypothetical protein
VIGIMEKTGFSPDEQPERVAAALREFIRLPG